MEYVSHYHSPLGPMTMASNGHELTGLWFDGQEHFGSTLYGNPMESDLFVFALARTWLDTYFRGVVPGFFPPLALIGTPFQVAVWELLKTVPYGTTVSYRELADRLAEQKNLGKMSAQAVGQAVGNNPISVIVPCHRVIGSDGSLTGYAGGLDKKEALLALEQGQGMLA